MTKVVDVLELGEVQLPDWHLRFDDVTSLIRAFAIRQPDGVILFDTGVGHGRAWIDETYRPRVTAIVDALNDVRVDERDAEAIANSHLLIDHCGQHTATGSYGAVALDVGSSVRSQFGKCPGMSEAGMVHASKPVPPSTVSVDPMPALIVSSPL